MHGNHRNRRGLIRELRSAGIRDRSVLEAIGSVPREDFVPPDARNHAYDNRPLAIGEGQTISQPYIVALMTAAARVNATSRVLEIGTGCGYQTAVLLHLGCEVFSIEARPRLADAARERLGDRRGLHLIAGNGLDGWKVAAPFDAIIVTAAPDHVPDPLREQLVVGGRLVIPVGEIEGPQELLCLTRRADGGYACDRLGAVRFVPVVPLP